MAFWMKPSYECNSSAAFEAISDPLELSNEIRKGFGDRIQFAQMYSASASGDQCTTHGQAMVVVAVPDHRMFILFLLTDFQHSFSWQHSHFRELTKAFAQCSKTIRFFSRKCMQPVQLGFHSQSSCSCGPTHTQVRAVTEVQAQ